ncbi:MAG: tetratricopeptide repeat protein [Candidatus Omnitrophica bacterium]|nr:tetratricopeptide repeat protein [Candidatus Omnitrophota bacterium]
MRGSLLKIMGVIVCGLIVIGIVFSNDSWAQQLLTNDSEKIDFAQGLLSQGQYTLAVAQFDEFIGQFPSSPFVPDAYLGAGEARFFMKEYDKAVESFEKYIAQFPQGKDKGTAQVRLGQIQYIKGSYEAALKSFNETNAESLSPQFKQTLYFFKGQIFATQNNRDEAIANLKSAAEAVDASFYTAQAYLKWGALIVEADPAGALEKYAKAWEKADNDDLKADITLRQGEAYYLQKEYDQAATIFTQTMNQNAGKPVMVDAMANLYTVLVAQKRFDVLITNFNQQLKGAVDKSEYFNVYLLAAKAFAGSGNVDGALTMLEQIAALNGISPQQKADVILQKARILFDAGKFADLPAFVDEKVALAPEVKSALVLLKAKAYLNLKDYDKAWATYDAITKELPQELAATQALCGMAYARYGQEKFEEAAGIFLDCFNKSTEGALRQEALFNAFSTYKKAGNDDKIIETGQQYLSLTPGGSQKSQVAISLSGIYIKRQQFDKAQEVLQPFANDSDETTRRNISFQMAYILQSSGKMDEALSSYQTFISDGKNDRLTYLALKNSCMVYLQKKEEDKAAELMNKVISDFANDNDFSLKTYLWLAEYWQTKNDAQKMLDVMAVAEKKYAQDPEAFQISFFKGQAYRMQENCKSAFENYDVVISAKDSIYKGRARLGKGICSTGLGDYAGAAKELEQAIVDSPNDIFVAMRARFALARNAELMKNFDLAVKLYLVVDVLYNDPEFAPKSLLRAAVILEEQLNNKTEAMNAYNKIVQVYPNSPEAQSAREKIGQPK